MASVAAALPLLLAGMLAQQAQSPAADSAATALKLQGAVRGLHDVAIAKEGDTYYVFGSGSDVHRSDGPPPSDRALRPQFLIRCSKDLHTWTRCGSVFPAIPAWIRDASPNTEELWAPDISYTNGTYRLYYAYSIVGRTTSGIALATNATLDPNSPQYKWVDRGLVVRSTDGDDWNAIDPNAVLDEGGQAWLSYGSFWTGIKLRRVDGETGLLPKHSKVYSLAARGQSGWREGGELETTAEEAPFLFRHNGWYYLFVSWDFCCRGVQSNYREMVGRSRTITGPYVDRDGKKMKDGGGTEVLSGNSAWAGPGGASLFHDGATDLIVFHALSARDGRPSLQISTVSWEDDWPHARLGEAPDR